MMFWINLSSLICSFRGNQASIQYYLVRDLVDISSVDENFPDLTSDPDYDILKYTMAAILHVETKQAAT